MSFTTYSAGAFAGDFKEDLGGQACIPHTHIPTLQRHGTGNPVGRFRVMKIWLVVPALAIAGCSSTNDQELEAVKSARSVLVEWALVESESARHNTTQAYVNSMRAEARSQLRSAQGELKNRPAAAKLIAKVLAEPVDAPSLRAVAIRLLPLETQLENS